MLYATSGMNIHHLIQLKGEGVVLATKLLKLTSYNFHIVIYCTCHILHLCMCTPQFPSWHHPLGCQNPLVQTRTSKKNKGDGKSNSVFHCLLTSMSSCGPIT